VLSCRDCDIVSTWNSLSAERARATRIISRRKIYTLNQQCPTPHASIKAHRHRLPPRGLGIVSRSSQPANVLRLGTSPNCKGATTPPRPPSICFLGIPAPPLSHREKQALTDNVGELTARPKFRESHIYLNSPLIRSSPFDPLPILVSCPSSLLLTTPLLVRFPFLAVNPSTS
jgi:hypothetical protein